MAPFSSSIPLEGEGISSPASFTIASTVGSSKFVRSGALLRSHPMALSENVFLFFLVICFGKGRFVRLDNANAVGSATSDRSGLLFLSQLMASSSAFNFAARVTTPAGSGTPANLVIASRPSSSRSSRPGSLFLNQLRALSTKAPLLSPGFPVGMAIPVALARACRVGSSRSPGSTSLLRSQLIASSMAFAFDSSGESGPRGLETPAKLVTASTVGLSRFESISGSFLRNQRRVSSKNSAFSSEGISLGDFGSATPVSFENALTVGLSRSVKSGLLFRNHCTASSMACLRESSGPKAVRERVGPAKFTNAASPGSSKF